MKIGRTEAGQRMAMAHTGHLTGSDDVMSAFFRQYGIVRVDDLDELLETVGAVHAAASVRAVRGCASTRSPAAPGRTWPTCARGAG